MATTSPSRTMFMLASLLVPACMWAHLDAIGSSGGPLDAATDDAVVDVETLDSAPDSEADAPTPASDSPREAFTAPETSSSDEAAGPTACGSGVTPVRQWTFDSNTEGWTTLHDTGTTALLSWSGTRGNPPGALQFDVTPGTQKGAWLQSAASFGDLSHRIASAWVWLDSGTSPHLKLFVQTGPTYAWADGGTVVLVPRAWTCVSLDISAPQYNQPNYDPTNVVALGFETQGTDPFRLYVDDVRYY